MITMHHIKLLIVPENLEGINKTYTIDLKVQTRGDFMVWDFLSRRPLPVRDHMVSIKVGP